MPWFVVDDSAHSHPKFIKAGNAAVGLWMRCGSDSGTACRGFIRRPHPIPTPHRPAGPQRPA